jgi:hypothetical protein
MTFKDLYTQLMEFADSPAISVQRAAKTAINEAMLWTNRTRLFKFAEDLTTVEYPENTLYVDMTQYANGEILHLMSAQIVTDDSPFVGIPIPIVNYDSLQGTRFQQRMNQQTSFVDEETKENDLSSVYKYRLFQVGNGFGLFPTPANPVKLLLHFGKKLRPLTLDNDENFLTQYCPDFLVTKALVGKFSYYVRGENLKMLTPEYMALEWSSVIEWDKAVRAANYVHSL